MRIFEGFREGNKYILSTEKGYLYFIDKIEADKFIKINGDEAK